MIRSFALVMIAVALVMIAGSSKNSNTETPKSPGNPDTQSPPPAEQQQNSSSVQTLKIYDGTSDSLNRFQAVNVDPGKFFFDFDYMPTQNEELALVYESVKSTLIGCVDSDIGFGFTLHQKNDDGKIDLSAYKGLGPAPIGVTQGMSYVVRASIDVRKGCLGIAYSFRIESVN